MIELTRSHESSGGGIIRVVGVGGAGARAVDRLCREGAAGVELFVANTDARALAASLTPNKITLGRSLTRGLGAGGDPELGRSAAIESSAELAGRLSGASLVIVVAGLGGGTGSGAAPEIAAIARSQGALVLVVATMPFQFEGRRRKDQALEALDGLRRSTDLVVCFDNQRMASIVGPAAGIEDAFEVVDALLAQVIRSLSSLMRRRNVLNSGLDEVAATVAGARSTALFGFGVADGEGRAEGALARALQSALLDKGHRLGDADRLWVHVAGGEDMRWSEVQAIMTRASSLVADPVRIFCGASVDPSLAGTISVTLLAGVPDSAVSRQCVEGPGALQPALQAVSPQYFPDRSEGELPQMQSPLNTVLPAAGPMSPSVSAMESEPHQEDLAAVVEEPVRTEIDALSTNDPEPAFVQAQEEVIAVQDDVPSFSGGAPRRNADPAQPEPASHVVNNRVMEEANALPGAPVTGDQQPSGSVSESLDSTPVEIVAPASVIGVGGSVENIRRETRQPAVVSQAVSIPENENALKKKPTVQEQMKFEQVSRGRFEKTDPTIVDGEDLDVPTFLRRRKDV